MEQEADEDAENPCKNSWAFFAGGFHRATCLKGWQNRGMLGEWVRPFLHPDANASEAMKSFFLLSQLAVGVLLVGGVIYFRSRRPPPGFRPGAEETSRPGARRKGPDLLAEARIKRTRQAEPLRLTGIRIDGAPHEVLGVSADATAAEIQSAWRELMKRYHPDRVGRPGSREWQDAQKIAEAINHAKDELLKSPAHARANRSGR
jgi:hypothetical protein